MFPLRKRLRETRDDFEKWIINAKNRSSRSKPPAWLLEKMF
jgi:hypothetical protein